MSSAEPAGRTSIRVRHRSSIDDEPTILIAAGAPLANIETSLLLALESIPADKRSAIKIWAEDMPPAGNADGAPRAAELDRALAGFGLEGYRDLWQMRCDLPIEASRLQTRAFEPHREADIDALLRVNNRAFAWHPEQADMTRARIENLMDQEWFEASGLRLYEDGGELMGFCWTKIHFGAVPVLGEIFVIGVDPTKQGAGLGSELTRAGLDWLYSRGLRTALLYVEASNLRAIRTYRKLGFTHYLTNRAFRPVDPTAFDSMGDHSRLSPAKNQDQEC